VAGATLLLHLAGTIAQNLPGVLDDVDSEFLHDLRVAVRRTRSAQRQLLPVFAPEPIARFRDEFRWVQQATGPTRDLDVYLWQLDDLSGGLPESRRIELEPLRRLLRRRRAAERRKLLRALRSDRFRTLMSDWQAFLEQLEASSGDDPAAAAQPIAELAGERIRALHRRMVKAGAAIDVDTPAEALHDLRKLGKELRYLLEFFASLYPADLVTPMVAALRGLQDTLGRFYDREIQAGSLRSLGREVAALPEGPETLMAMGLLVERLESDQAAARSEFGERFAAFASKRQRELVRSTFA
jgi:CHAD domain-containing protein